MDAELVSGIVGIVLGGSVSAIAYGWKLRDEKRKTLKLALYEVVRITLEVATRYFQSKNTFISEYARQRGETVSDKELTIVLDEYEELSWNLSPPTDLSLLAQRFEKALSSVAAYCPLDAAFLSGLGHQPQRTVSVEAHASRLVDESFTPELEDLWVSLGTLEAVHATLESKHIAASYEQLIQRDLLGRGVLPIAQLLGHAARYATEKRLVRAIARRSHDLEATVEKVVANVQQRLAAENDGDR